MSRMNTLGLLEYTKQSHSDFYHKILKEYNNYNNWLSSTFLSLGHIYRRINSKGRSVLYVLDAFKPILDANSLKLSYTYLIHLSIYNREDCNYEEDKWYTLDKVYEMLLEDVTPKYGMQQVSNAMPCDINFRILPQVDNNEMNVIKTRFHHHSNSDYRYDNEKGRIVGTYNRHYCTCEYTIYTYELVDGEWQRRCSTYLNKIRLAADNTQGWCHDTDINGVDCFSTWGHYDGCWKNLRDVKKKFFEIESLAKCETLFDDIDFLKTDMFMPYPIVENKSW